MSIEHAYGHHALMAVETNRWHQNHILYFVYLIDYLEADDKTMTNA
jgi:hypothetical protein